MKAKPAFMDSEMPSGKPIAKGAGAKKGAPKMPVAKGVPPKVKAGKAGAKKGA